MFHSQFVFRCYLKLLISFSENNFFIQCCGQWVTRVPRRICMRRIRFWEILRYWPSSFIFLNRWANSTLSLRRVWPMEFQVYVSICQNLCLSMYINLLQIFHVLSINVSNHEIFSILTNMSGISMLSVRTYLLLWCFQLLTKLKSSFSWIEI